MNFETLLAVLPQRTIFGNAGEYLTRYKLLHLGKKFVRVYLHKFHRSDEDREHHNHPWKWAVAIVLKGGYVEERMVAGRMMDFLRTAGSVVVLTGDTYHRVDLLDEENGSWSLFIAGPERDSWNFKNPFTKEIIPWQEFIRRKGLVPTVLG